MKPYSVTRRLIATVLLLELLSAFALTWLAMEFEHNSRLRSFDISLRAHAETLFGAVGDADDPLDNVVLDLRGLTFPAADIYEVSSTSGVLGRSPSWPAASIDAQVATASGDGIYRVNLNHHAYRFVIFHAVRIVDPGEKGGGVNRPIVVRYGASTEHVWREVWEAVRFNALASLLLLSATGIIMSWFLRRSLAPLSELASEASKITAQQWNFHPRERARSMVELAPLVTALELALKRLHQSFEQQRRFTSDSAHELKTDVAIAKSSLQLLTMRQRTAEEYERGLEVCLTDALRIERTVTEMLTLARVESEGEGASAGEPRTAADFTLCLHNSIQMLTSFADLKQVLVRVDASKRMRVQLAEEDAGILCTNLLLNALQHSRPLTEVYASLTESGGWMILAVKDQGSGIPAESISHVFEPFYRGDASRDRRSGSTGLGLAICKGICDKAGGTISIRSGLGEGTEVAVRLPTVAWSVVGSPVATSMHPSSSADSSLFDARGA